MAVALSFLRLASSDPLLSSVPSRLVSSLTIIPSIHFRNGTRTFCSGVKFFARFVSFSDGSLFFCDSPRNGAAVRADLQVEEPPSLEASCIGRTAANACARAARPGQALDRAGNKVHASYYVCTWVKKVGVKQGQCLFCMYSKIRTPAYGILVPLFGSTHILVWFVRPRPYIGKRGERRLSCSCPYRPAGYM